MLGDFGVSFISWLDFIGFLLYSLTYSYIHIIVSLFSIIHISDYSRKKKAQTNGADHICCKGKNWYIFAINMTLYFKLNSFVIYAIRHLWTVMNRSLFMCAVAIAAVCIGDLSMTNDEMTVHAVRVVCRIAGWYERGEGKSSNKSVSIAAQINNHKCGAIESDEKPINPLYLYDCDSSSFHFHLQSSDSDWFTNKVFTLCINNFIAILDWCIRWSCGLQFKCIQKFRARRAHTKNHQKLINALFRMTLQSEPSQSKKYDFVEFSLS